MSPARSALVQSLLTAVLRAQHRLQTPLSSWPEDAQFYCELRRQLLPLTQILIISLGNSCNLSTVGTGTLILSAHGLSIKGVCLCVFEPPGRLIEIKEQ